MKRYFLPLIIMMTLTNCTLAQTAIPLNELIGQFDQSKHPDFIALDKTILPVNKPGMYLRREAAEQLIKAFQAFKKQHPHIPFIVVSATRNFQYQSGIWQRKWQNFYARYHNPQATAAAILEYSSMPGTSRHHWGTDVDITSVTSDYFLKNKQGKMLYQWMVENMPKYGFCQAYNAGRTVGYQTEEWHWSYQPLASQYIQSYREYILHQPQLILEKLQFNGADQLDLPNLIDQYVFSVNSACF